MYFSSENHSVIVINLNPFQDLKKELQLLCQKNQIHAAAVISVVGSLEKLNIRLANSGEFYSREEKFEILSLQGLLSYQGLHLHLAVADAKGQVVGGHLLDGNLIYTTCELVLLIMNDLNFEREYDNSTGYKELKIVSLKPSQQV